MFTKPSDYFERLAARLTLIAAHTFRARVEMPPFAIKSEDGDWQAIPNDSYWGQWQHNFLLKSSYQIPAEWPLDATIALHLNLGDAGDSFEAHPEALIYVDDAPVTAVDVRHKLLPLTAGLKDYAEHQLLLDGWTGLGGSLWGDQRQRLYMQPSAVVLIDDAAHQFVVLARNVLGAIKHMPPDTPTQIKLQRGLTDALNRVDTRYPIDDKFYASIPVAYDALRAVVAGAGQALDVTIHAAGHAHIDTAWLWTLAQTRRKVARTFHTVLNLMERFPEYHFTHSQPQLYEFIRQDHPELFARIQQAVKDGRWEPIGGMWVEADCNITGPESLIRQFLLGRRYFREHFGLEAESPVLWLPDTFGFPATLPQIMAEAGIRYFFTTKIRWNEVNDFPYDSFWWEGLDGTRVLAHITPTPMQGWLRMATYNADANAQSLIETWGRMKHKNLQNRALMAYGWGDGGGGPTPEMLENLEVLRDFPGVPRSQQGKAIDFFTALEAESGDDLPVWNGELYLETHQGTLTSQAWIKRANRKAEVLLHDTEYLAVRAMLLDDDYVYPQDELNAAWRTLLLNQFHDILPGSSIAEVYDDAREQFAALTESVTALRDAALGVLARHVDGDWLVVNTVDWHQPGVVRIPQRLNENQYIIADQKRCITQEIAEGTLIDIPNGVVSFGTVALCIAEDDSLDIVPDVQQASTLVSHTDRLENHNIRVQFDDSGHLISIADVATGREWLQRGGIGNQFQFFEDRPLRFDAWNIDPDFEDRMWTIDAAESVEVVETGPIRATLKMVWRYMQSTITQYVSLYADSWLGLEFRTYVDWQERNTLLKVAFPININTDHATYHIQWGEVQRPTHRSTPWDGAKYEVAAHQWASLQNKEDGVILVNDCKYGCDIHENVMRLTLLKGATYPDPNADIVQHEFTYRLHTGHHSEVACHELGQHLNTPPLIHPITNDADLRLLNPVVYTFDSIKLETIKQAEDKDGIILRLYAHSSDYADSDETSLSFDLPITAVWRVNLLEERQEQLEIFSNNSVKFQIRQGQIITLLVIPEGWA